MMSDRLDQTKQLQSCEKDVIIDDPEQLEECMKQVEEYEQNNQQYMIGLYLYQFDSLDDKVSIMNMLTQLNADGKVGIVSIDVTDPGQWNQQLFDTMMQKYPNVYYIDVIDNSSEINTAVHDMVQDYVKQQSTLLEFSMLFDGDLQEKPEGLQLIKQYNQVMQQKEHLEQLEYQHSEIDDSQFAKTRQEVEQLLQKVDGMQSITL